MARRDGTMRTLGSVGSVGFAFVIAVLLGWWFGSVLDRWFDTRPWFTFVFFFFGVVAGGLNVFRSLGALGSSSPRDDG